ncbi:MAG: hypothetical protein IH948_08445, partial [Bacteroidetes bacterium]|nr:hypothetical protein [Bacteroidota bacterium]
RRRDPDFGNVFIRIIDGVDGIDENYDLDFSNGIYELTIRNIFVSYEVDKNKIRRDFGLRVKFNNEGSIGDVEVMATE